MDEIKRLKHISLVSRLTAEISKQTGLSDKTLAEFVLDIHGAATSTADFRQKLADAGADFEEGFVNTLDTIIRQQMPGKDKKDVKEKKEEKEKKDGKDSRSVFKGLSIPDTQPARADRQERHDTSKRRRRSISDEDSPSVQRDRHRRRRSISNDGSPSARRDRHRRRHSFSDEDSPSARRRRRPISPSARRDRNRRRHSFSDDGSPSARHRRHHNPTSPPASRSLDKTPVLGKIYDGTVTSLASFGAFVAVDGVAGRPDGLVHVSAIQDGARLGHPSEALRRGQQVKVKVVKLEGRRIGLSMKTVDQRTGMDMEPSVATGANSYGLRQTEPASVPGGPPRRKRLTSPERWELRQLVASGALSASDCPDLNDDVQAMQEPAGSEPEEDVDIEVRDEEPPFLSGQTKQSLELSPVRVVKAPEGSLNRAAMSGATLARERREERQQKSKEQAKDEQERGQRDDPLVAASSLAKDRNDAVPEWKKVARHSKDVSYGRRTTLSMDEQRKSLPVYQLRDQLVQAVKDNQILIVVGDTGSGKTTQITQYLAEEGFTRQGIIGCTQPRRVAAVSVAKRVAEEADVKLGEEVGFNVRFNDCTSSRTRIKYMTDGMLQREALLDPDMSQYSVIMLDEAHERTIATDVLFALLKKAATRRPNLRLIITSATLDAEKFSSYFFSCPILYIPGRTFPVEVLYTKEPEFDYLDAALMTVMQIHLSEPQGDILVFLTGQEEIDTACEALDERMRALGPDVPELVILPVYSALPSEMQSKIFEPAAPGARKVVIATNIAETSITIDGIYYVVDPGFVKINAYDAKLGMDSLVISPISQAQANQRAGRAGRTGPGKCYRLYTEQAFQTEMLPNTIPEIQRQNLSNTILMLKAMGINDLLTFDFMDPPPLNTMLTALEELHSLLALDDEGLLTRLGRKMADFPMEPSLAKVLISSVDAGCSAEMLTIVAMLSVQNVFYRPKEKQAQADQKKAKFHDPAGDHLMLLNVYEGWERHGRAKGWCVENFVQERSLKRAQDVRRQLVSIMERYKHAVVSCGPQKRADAVRRVLCSGFFRNAARKDAQEGYKTLIEGTPVYLHPSSALFGRPAEYVVYHTLLLTTKEYMHCVTAVNPRWLAEAAPTFFKVADPTRLSKRKRQEKIQPLFDRYAADPNEWRLSAQKRSAKGGSTTFG